MEANPTPDPVTTGDGGIANANWESAVFSLEAIRSLNARRMAEVVSMVFVPSSISSTRCHDVDWISSDDGWHTRMRGQNHGYATICRLGTSTSALSEWTSLIGRGLVVSYAKYGYARVSDTVATATTTYEPHVVPES